MVLRHFELTESEIFVYEVKHTPGERVTRHHHSVYEILYFLDGEGTITLEDQTYDISGGQMVLIVPYSEHSVHARTRMTVLVLVFGDFLAGLASRRELFARALSKSKCHMLDTMSANELRDSFRKILYEQNRRDSFSDLAMRSHLLHVLLVLARKWETDRYPDSNAHRANVLRHYIETHYFERISADDLAAMLKVTPRHMNSIFKQQFGLTPMQYLNDVRIRQAKELLAETEKEVVSICFEVGFEALSTFYRAFKNKVGLSPQEYRRQAVVGTSAEGTVFP
ncbi:MAG: AraC family transcriptional regulator [Alicyclobacillus sp.]|nr:AraC family transcriptional regulator [Alicyclobacillus sp.]